MRRVLKIAGSAVAALLAVLGAAAVFLASPWFAEFAKAQAVEAMHSQYRRTLRIDGPLEFSFYPRLGFSVTAVSLSEPDSADEFARVAAARLGVVVAPLFSRRVVVEACELSGLRAALVRHKDGTLNIDDLLAPTQPAGPPWQLDVAACRLAATELAWRDQRSGATAALKNLALAGDGMQVDTGSKALRADRLALGAALVVPPRPPVRLDLVMSGVAGSPETLEVSRLGIDFDAAMTDAAVKGALASPFVADFGGRTLALGELSGSLALAHPRLVRPLQLPLAGTLRADLRRQSAAGRLSARLDDSKLALKLAVTRFSPPQLVFELDIDRLDVDRYVKPATGAKPERAAAKSGAPSAAGLDARGTVRIGSLSVGAVKASKVALRIASVDGRLDTEALKALAGN